jgi:predicted nucleic acid-binding protein
MSERATSNPSPQVLDSTVLSNFASTDSVWVLDETLHQPTTVPVVQSELARGVDVYPFLSAFESPETSPIPILSPSGLAEVLTDQFQPQLDPGEAQVVAIAEVREGTAVTDDGDGRAAVDPLNASLTGSIGVLATAVERGIVALDIADEWHETWVEKYDFRSPVPSISAMFDTG